MNRAQIEGNLGAEPDFQYTRGGKAVCRLRVATGGQEYPDKKTGAMLRAPTEWHTVEFWDGWAERAAKVCHKGSFVHVEGTICYRTWDKPDGSKGYATVIRGRLLCVFPRRPRAGGDNVPPIEEPAGAQPSAPPPGDHDGHDDIPF